MRFRESGLLTLGRCRHREGFPLPGVAWQNALMVQEVPVRMTNFAHPEQAVGTFSGQNEGGGQAMPILSC